jgi:hypothetical protein
VNERAATDVFEKDCMIYLGTAIAPRGVAKEGARCLKYEVRAGGRTIAQGEQAFGEIAKIPLGTGETAEILMEPAKGFDVGAGPGKARTAKVHGGEVGLVIDTRGRPLQMHEEKRERYQQLQRWARALDLYPEKGAAPGDDGQMKAPAKAKAKAS